MKEKASLPSDLGRVQPLQNSCPRVCSDSFRILIKCCNVSSAKLAESVKTQTIVFHSEFNFIIIEPDGKQFSKETDISLDLMKVCKPLKSEEP